MDAHSTPYSPITHYPPESPLAVHSLPHTLCPLSALCHACSPPSTLTAKTTIIGPFDLFNVRDILVRHCCSCVTDIPVRFAFSIHKSSWAEPSLWWRITQRNFFGFIGLHTFTKHNMIGVISVRYCPKKCTKVLRLAGWRFPHDWRWERLCRVRRHSLPLPHISAAAAPRPLHGSSAVPMLHSLHPLPCCLHLPPSPQL